MGRGTGDFAGIPVRSQSLKLRCPELMTTTFANFENHVLDDGHHFFVGQLPDSLRLEAAGFQALWNMHPEGFASPMNGMIWPRSDPYDGLLFQCDSRRVIAHCMYWT